MAEVLGVVASGISVASIVIQIADSLNKVIAFFESVREAPTDIQRLVLELNLLSNIISDIRDMIDSDSIPHALGNILQHALNIIRHDIASLSSLSSEFDRKLKSERKIGRTWARMQIAFSEKKISLLRSYLESAKGGLHLLQGCIIMFVYTIPHSIARQVPKTLGYNWETGDLKDHLRVDDGLGTPLTVPLELCSTLQDLVSVLEIKYKSRTLPGLSQVQQRHIAIFDGTQSFKIDDQNWKVAVIAGGRIKIAFLMSTWHGLSRTKCIRCFKPYKHPILGLGFTKCLSCQLEVLRVEPESITFEMTDIVIGFHPNQYRDHLVSTRKKSSPVKNHLPPSREPTSVEPNRNRTCENPPIDLVCNRLVVKWEPMFNIVHRYILCRCVIRRSTPSTIEREQTILILARCPRHNKNGVFYKDYGNIDYDQDPYFDIFGGYRTFQGFIHRFSPDIYALLGGEKFLPAEYFDEATSAITKNIAADAEGTMKLLNEYIFEMYDELENECIELPEDKAEFVKLERLRRQQQTSSRRNELGLGFQNGDIELSEEYRKYLSESPMMTDLEDILSGKWDGKPHWANFVEG